MNIEFDYTPADFQTALDEDPNRPRWNRPFLGGGLVLIGTVLFAGALYAGFWDGRYANALFLLVLAGIAIRGAWTYLGGRGRRALKDPFLRERQHFEISDAGIVMRTPTAQQHLSWDIWKTAREATDIFVLRANDGRSTLGIPKRAFSPEQLAEFRELLGRKLPAK